MSKLLKKETHWERTPEILWQKEGEVFRPNAFASRLLTDCEKKYAINGLEILGALFGLENVYEKRVNLLTNQQALQPLLKK